MTLINDNKENINFVHHGTRKLIKVCFFQLNIFTNFMFIRNIYLNYKLFSQYKEHNNI